MQPYASTTTADLLPDFSRISGSITGYNCIITILFLLGRFSGAGFDGSTVVYGEITGVRSTASPGPTARPVDTQGKI